MITYRADRLDKWVKDIVKSPQTTQPNLRIEERKRYPPGGQGRVGGILISHPLRNKSDTIKI